MAFSVANVRAAPPARIVFDTDIGNDIDDVIALALIHALETKGETKLLAVTITKDNQYAGPLVDALNTFYGRPRIPIGTVRNGKTPETGSYLKQVVESGLYPHGLKDGQQAPDAVSLLRQILAGEKDHAVSLVQVGFSTNLARLLDSSPDKFSMLSGKELVRKKVRQVVAMAGSFPAGKREYNVYTDVEAARKLMSDCPVPIVFSGYEVGNKILFPAASIERDYSYVPHHPVADAYRDYMRMPYDRPMWDVTAVLYAVEPKTAAGANSFDLSEPGRVTVDDAGVTHFQPEKDGPHRYLLASDAQAAQSLARMIELASQKPGAKTRSGKLTK